MQRAAQGQVNTTVTDRYYGAASSTPAVVFPGLMHNVQNNLGKLRRTNPGKHAALSVKVAEIAKDVEDFPEILTMRSQGLFALG